MSMLRTLLEQADRYTFTENGAVAFKSTGNPLLDFFALGGAMRGRDLGDILTLFTRAFAHDPLRALKCVFYFRDCRGGQGERDVPRAILRHLANTHPEIVAKNLHLLPEYGRWDDLLVFLDTPVEKQAIGFIRDVLQKELEPGAKPSLIWKWLPSVNTSSRESRAQARKIIKYLGWTERQYRKILAKKRRELDVVEVKMTAQEWDKINYPAVPAYAMKLYRNAFRLHDPDRFNQYLIDLAAGKSKINANVLYPYDIIRAVYRSSWNDPNTPLYEAQWEEIKRGFTNDDNALAVVDVSGSMLGMNGLPIFSSIALGLLLAETNRGPWRNFFITFSAHPRLQQIQGGTLRGKIYSMMKNAGYNTNVEAVFDLLLRTAVQHKVPQEEMPRKIVIISDMEFDAARYTEMHGSKSRRAILGGDYACENTSPALFRAIRERWRQAGYEMPTLIFWNVAARNTQVPMTRDDRGVIFVSGHSPSIFKNILNPEALDGEKLMLEVLDSDRYAPVTL